VTKAVVLCFVGGYLPGFRFGGPVRSISTMVDLLSHDFDFRIVTPDRDLGCHVPYEGVSANQWTKVGGASVFYASPSALSFSSVVRLIRETPHDVLYLNSFFSLRFSLFQRIAIRLGLVPPRPCVMAPRGEFSSGALRIKRWKKIPFMWLVRFFRIDRDVVWHATSETELQEIKSALKYMRSNAVVAAAEVSGQVVLRREIVRASSKTLRIVFISRLAEKKNLHFLLSALQYLQTPVILDIYGSVEDERYWAKCKAAMNSLPHHIRVTYCGEVTPQSIQDVFSLYDLFAFPTHGENYGHVIAESLGSGTPVLLSDQTPWVPDRGEALTVLPLDLPAWSSALEKWALLSDQERRARGVKALEYWSAFEKTDERTQQNIDLFKLALAT
jgi:glycosyltransferase involved in cell wall biosynthesis